VNFQIPTLSAIYYIGAHPSFYFFVASDIFDVVVCITNTFNYFTAGRFDKKSLDRT
jgi:hypothetical protein